MDQLETNPVEPARIELPWLCPRCRVSLCAFSEDASLAHCVKCDGTLVVQRELPNLLRALAAELAEQGAIEEKVQAVPDRGAGIPCPNCSQVMHNYGFLEGKEVKLDGCLGCGLVWLDADEFEAAAAMYGRSMKAEQLAHVRRQQLEKEGCEMMTRIRYLGMRVRAGRRLY